MDPSDLRLGHVVHHEDPGRADEPLLDQVLRPHVARAVEKLEGPLPEVDRVMRHEVALLVRELLQLLRIVLLDELLEQRPNLI